MCDGTLGVGVGAVRDWRCLVLGVLKVSGAYRICGARSGDEGERRKNDLS